MEGIGNSTLLGVDYYFPKVQKTNLKMPVVYRLLLGILTFVSSTSLILILFTKTVKIHNLHPLKWLPLLMAFLGFFLAGKINQKSKLIFTMLLLLGLLIYQPFELLYFPHFYVVVLISILAILLTRNEIRTQLKLGIGLLSLILFGFYLFNQALIIENKGFGTDSNNNLYNATVLWDFTNGQLKKLPVVDLEDIHGNKVELKNFEGKILYLSFWATWCGPSLTERPDLEKLREEFQSNPKVVFIDISVDSNREDWISFISKNKPKGIQLIAKNEVKAKVEFEFSCTPSHFIVDYQGNFKKCSSPRFIEKNLLSAPILTSEYVQTPYKVFKIIQEDGNEKLIRVK